MHDCPLFSVRALRPARGNNFFEIRAGHDNERVATSKFDHDLLDPLRRCRAHFHTGFFAPRQRRCISVFQVQPTLPIAQRATGSGIIKIETQNSRLVTAHRVSRAWVSQPLQNQA